MYEYDLILEELNERVACGELTLEEAELINDYAYEAYVIEGANSDARQEFKTASRQIKQNIKACKRMYKEGDLRGAAKKADVGIQNCDKLMSVLTEIQHESSLGTTILGMILNDLITTLKAVIVAIPTFGLGAIIVKLKDSLSALINILNFITNKNRSVGDLNSYIRSMKDSTMTMKKTLMAIKRKCMRK